MMKGGMAGLMKQAQQMQEKMAKMQEELANAEVTGKAGGDMVTVVMGREDMGDRPTPLLRRLDDRIEFRCIDRRRFARLGAVKKYAEVVTSAWEYLDL